MGSKKMGFFLMWKNGGHLACKNAVSSQNLQILRYNYRKICKFLQMRAKRAKICNFCVKFDTKVKKKGLGCGLKKKGSLGVRSA